MPTSQGFCKDKIRKCLVRKLEQSLAQSKRLLLILFYSFPFQSRLQDQSSLLSTISLTCPPVIVITLLAFTSSTHFCSKNVLGILPHGRQQGRNGDKDSYCPALEDFSAWTEPNKQKAVKRGMYLQVVDYLLTQHYGRPEARLALKTREGFSEEVTNKWASVSRIGVSRGEGGRGERRVKRVMSLESAVSSVGLSMDREEER